MGDARTGTDTNDNLLSTYFFRKLIKVLHEKVWFYQLATKFPLPKAEGSGVVFNGWRRLAAASSILGEGSANATVNLSSRKVTATVVQYGQFPALATGNC
jgi:N4-gp56 family major capsid protein